MKLIMADGAGQQATYDSDTDRWTSETEGMAEVLNDALKWHRDEHTLGYEPTFTSTARLVAETQFHLTVIEDEGEGPFDLPEGALL